MWKEPLVHFLLGGAALLGAYEVLLAPDPPDRIEVSRGTVESLARRFARQAGRAPTPEERRGLVEDHVAEEVLYREAIALELDRSDPIVRRRLIQRMRFVLEGMAEGSVEEDEPALEAFYAADPSRYATPGATSFVHVFFAADPSAPPAAARRDAALADLEPRPSSGGVGDPFPHGDRFDAVAPARIRRLFGDGFADRLLDAPEGAWTPIASSFGEHAVWVTERAAPEVPAFPEVRDEVREAWLDQERAAMVAEALDALRAGYDVIVADAPPAGPDS